MCGRQATLPVDIQFGTMHDKHQSTNEYLGDSYEPGELVWLLNPKVPKNTSKKPFHPWTGPFKMS